jgi:hypothetical protein
MLGLALVPTYMSNATYKILPLTHLIKNSMYWVLVSECEEINSAV